MNIVTEFKELKDTLFNKKIIRHKMRRIQNKNHKMKTCEINKISLYVFGEKKFVLLNEIFCHQKLIMIFCLKISKRMNTIV